MSVTCLVIFKVKLNALNYRQTYGGCKRMKNKGLPTKFSGDPLDRRPRCAKIGADWGFCGPAGAGQESRADGTAFAFDFAALTGAQSDAGRRCESGRQNGEEGGPKGGKKEAKKDRKGTEKGAKKVVLGSFFRVFSTRIFGKYADDKRVNWYLHQTKCTFF
jgi:hypothetical protein